MFGLIKYVKGYRVGAVLGPLLKLLEALMETFVPFIMSDIINNGINKGDTVYVFNRGLLLVFIAVLGWIFSLSAQYFNGLNFEPVGRRLNFQLSPRTSRTIRTGRTNRPK